MEWKINLVNWMTADKRAITGNFECIRPCALVIQLGIQLVLLFCIDNYSTCINTRPND